MAWELANSVDVKTIQITSALLHRGMTNTEHGECARPEKVRDSIKNGEGYIGGYHVLSQGRGEQRFLKNDLDKPRLPRGTASISGTLNLKNIRGVPHRWRTLFIASQMENKKQQKESPEEDQCQEQGIRAPKRHF